MNKVLIIDDDKELCALMKKCIEQEKLSAVPRWPGATMTGAGCWCSGAF